MGFEAFGGGGFVGLAGGLVEAELDDRDVGVDGREEVVELGLGEIEFDLVEGFEGVAEVDEDQVALVAELGEEGGAGWGRRRPCVRGLCSASTAWAAMRSRSACGSGAPGFPVEAEELVEEAGAFKRERDGREIGQRKHLDAEHLHGNKWVREVADKLTVSDRSPGLRQRAERLRIARPRLSWQSGSG